MAFNVTFNNISVINIMAINFIGERNLIVPGENHQPAANH